MGTLLHSSEKRFATEEVVPATNDTTPNTSTIRVSVLFAQLWFGHAGALINMIGGKM